MTIDKKGNESFVIKIKDKKFFFKVFFLNLFYSKYQLVLING